MPVDPVRICATVEQDLDHVLVASGSSEVQWGHAVISCFVWIRATLQEDLQVISMEKIGLSFGAKKNLICHFDL